MDAIKCKVCNEYPSIQKLLFSDGYKLVHYCNGIGFNYYGRIFNIKDEAIQFWNDEQGRLEIEIAVLRSLHKIEPKTCQEETRPKYISTRIWQCEKCDYGIELTTLEIPEKCPICGHHNWKVIAD